MMLSDVRFYGVTSSSSWSWFTYNPKKDITRIRRATEDDPFKVNILNGAGFLSSYRLSWRTTSGNGFEAVSSDEFEVQPWERWGTGGNGSDGLGNCPPSASLFLFVVCWCEVSVDRSLSFCNSTSEFWYSEWERHHWEQKIVVGYIVVGDPSCRKLGLDCDEVGSCLLPIDLTANFESPASAWWVNERWQIIRSQIRNSLT